MMDKFKLILFYISLCTSALAEDNFQINFTGTVSDATCEIQADSKNPEIKLGELYNKDLEVAGSTTDWVSFNITLLNCPSAVKSVSARFSGTSDESDMTLYKSTGNAENIAVQLQDQNTQSVLSNGTVDTVNVISTGNAVFNLQARAKTPLGGVTAGTIESLIEMTFSYN
jgi:minor fimbrial subunit